MTEQEMAKAFDQLNGMVPEQARSSTVVLFAARSKQQHLIPYGTGSLFAIGERRFLVTAAHVPKEADRQKYSFLCATTKKGKFTPFLRGGWALMRKLDVAVFELSPQNAEDLEDNAFLRLADVALNADVNSGFFAIFGVPAVWSGLSLDDESGPVQIKALQFITTPYEGDVTVLQDFDPAAHIALAAGEDYHRNHDGEKINWPAPLKEFLPGISGCAIWKIADAFSPGAAANGARVVGVETGVFSKAGVIAGTRWGAVASLFRQRYPELRPALEIAWDVSQ